VRSEGSSIKVVAGWIDFKWKLAIITYISIALEI
jgi:hypothetical protein